MIRKSFTYILVTLAAFILSATFCAARNYVYSYSNGRIVSKVTFDVHGDRQHTTIDAVLPDMTAVHQLDGSYQTVSWHIVVKEEDTDVMIVLKDGCFNMEGTFKGKPFSHKEKSDGEPWYQHIGYVSGKVLGKSGKIEFVCIRPSDLKVHKMTAEVVGKEALGKYDNATCVKVCPAGMLARMWKSYYYFDPVTGEFLGYHAVEGVPGTPETYWILEN